MNKLNNLRIKLVNEEKIILSEIINNNILILKLNSPKTLNCISSKLTIELIGILKKAMINNNIKVVILTSNIKKYFCAGANIKEFDKFTSENIILGTYFDDIKIMFKKFNKPIICLLNGNCYGGGLELALLCDIVISKSNILLGFPEITLGILPSIEGTLISKTIGKSNAMKMIWTGEFINEIKGKELNIISEIYESDEKLKQKGIELAKKISKFSIQSIVQIKNSVKNSFYNNYEHAVSLEKNNFNSLISTEGFRKGKERFLNRKK